MANNKIGFNYYSIDTDRYLDIRIKRLKKQFKCDGIAIYDYILCEIYREKGCFIEWDENTLFDVADYFDVEESLINNVVSFCCEIGLFDKKLLEKEKALSSLSIQKRYVDWSIKAKRKNVKIPKHIKIQEEIEIIPEESFKIQERSNENSGTLRQRKEGSKESKESKGPCTNSSLKIKKKERAVAPPTFEEVKKYFLENGGTEEMARKFFDTHSCTGWFLRGSPIVNFKYLCPSYIDNWKKNVKNGSKISNEQHKNSKSAGAYELLDDIKKDCGINS